MGTRVGKYKLGARASKYKLAARASKYKLWARAGGSGTRAGAWEIQIPHKNTEQLEKCSSNLCIIARNNILEETKNYNSFDKQYVSYKRTSNAIFNMKKVDLDES